MTPTDTGAPGAADGGGGAEQLYWHFLPDSGYYNHDMQDVKAEMGVTITIDDSLAICTRGLHACLKPLDALRYTPGALVSLVQLGGTIIEEDDKHAASERTIIWMADATQTLHEFAIWCAEQALALIKEPDPRSLAALETKRRWLRGKATDAELTAALAAALDAAGAAALAAAGAKAGDAAGAKAGAAELTAAWAAALAAAGAAELTAELTAALAAALAAALDAAGAKAGAAALAAAGAAELTAAWAAELTAALDAAGAAALDAALAAQNEQLANMLMALEPKAVRS